MVISKEDVREQEIGKQPNKTTSKKKTLKSLLPTDNERSVELIRQAEEANRKRRKEEE